ncbi:MAG: HD domain-containing protein, partial [Myxococcota bacterium]
ASGDSSDSGGSVDGGDSGDSGAGDASLAGLTRFEEELARAGDELLGRMYPYMPAQVVQRRDVDELFDTTPDLTGADIDVSGFIRSGDERDVTVLWRDLAGLGAGDGGPRVIERAQVGTVERRELCPVPVKEIRAWLKKKGKVGYVLDFQSGAWQRLGGDEARRLSAGMMILLPAALGGYDDKRGWDQRSKAAVGEVRASASAADRGVAGLLDDSAAAQDDDSLSHLQIFKTIATHGRETGDTVRELGAALDLAEPYRALLVLAGRWHDAGKAHETFQGAIGNDGREPAGLRERRDLAKAPAGAWRMPPYPERPGFRHELVSALALFELLRRMAPDHPALLGSCGAMLAAAGIDPVAVVADERIAADDVLAAELAALDAHSFDVLAYVVCAHHGKVRCSWTGTPRDQEAGHAGIHGVCERDTLGNLRLCDGDGRDRAVPELTMWLDAAALGLNGRYGRSWTERVSELRRRLGPFALAYLETLLRAADARASQLTTEDQLL